MNKRTCSGTTHYRGFKVFLGDCLQGRVFSPWQVGKDYDFEYRLEWIKCNSEYTEFYHMCPLNGPEYIGASLEEAMDRLDLMHSREYASEHQAEVERLEEKLAGDIPF